MRKILVFRTEHIGDLIVIFPMLNRLKKNNPLSKITLVVDPTNKTLAESIPFVDEIILFKNYIAKRNISPFEVVINYLKMLFSLFLIWKFTYRRNFDLAIIPSSRKYLRLVLPFLHAKKKIWKLDPNYGFISEKIRCINLLDLPNFKPGDISKFNLRINKSSILKAKSLINKFSNKSSVNYVLHCKTPLKEKNWSLNNWKLLIEGIQKQRKNSFFYLIGSPEDSKFLKVLKKSLSLKVGCVIVDKFSIIDTLELIKLSDMFIGLDSGPMHLAGLTDIPIIALFGKSSNPIAWGPTGLNSKVFYSENINEIHIHLIVDYLNSLKLKI